MMELESAPAFKPDAHSLNSAVTVGNITGVNDAPAPDADAAKKIDILARRRLLGRFWHTARGFWGRKAGAMAWALTGALVVILFVQLYVQYQVNVWNRDVFDALERKDSTGVLYQSLLYIPLICASLFTAVAGVYARMTMQRRWRQWFTHHALDRWLANGRYYHLNLMRGEHENPEYRIGEDARIATDAPVDFAFGIASALLSAITFIAVLWVVGGTLDFAMGGRQFHIPGFLVIAALVYSIFATGAMALIGRQFVRLSEASNQSEAEFRYALTRLRENGESIALLGGEQEERAGLARNFAKVLDSWRVLLGQYMRTTFVSTSSGLIATVIPILLCAPKFLEGTMSLGEVMQAASAFATVQGAFSWLVDNYPRFANWSASARRITSLLVSIDALEKAESLGGIKRLSGSEEGQPALRLRGLSVKLDDGTGVVHEAEVDIAPGEKVLIVGESGTGKSTLVRAIAGLWPWGEGDIVMQRNSKLFMLPQRAYVPLGTLKRAVTYPLDADAVQEADVRDALEEVGLGHLKDRVNEDGPWEQTLSGGEKQRLAFARLLLHRPDLIVMDEATSALDPDSQERLLKLIDEKLPNATLISVGHRPELEEYHERKLVLEHRLGGARLISDEFLTFQPGRGVALIRRLLKWWPRFGAPNGGDLVEQTEFLIKPTPAAAGETPRENATTVGATSAEADRKAKATEAA
jgi:vitamin B12/bleomycin/antimicrobial peptide transport system ATP-binding/permease protein